MIKTISDLRVEQWQKIFEINSQDAPTEADRFEQSIRIACVIHGISTDRADEMAIEDLKKLLPVLSILSHPIKIKFPRKIKVNGRKYRVVHNASKLPTSSYLALSHMEFETASEVVANMHKIAALFTTGHEIDIAAEDMKCATFGDVYSIFIYNLRVILSLAKKASPEAAEILQTVNLN